MEKIWHSTFFNADILAGLLLLCLGGLMLCFPPRNRRAFYGYHSYLARRNADTWRSANRFAALFSVKLALFLLLLGLGAGYVFDAQSYWFYLLTAGTVIIAVMLLRGETEWYLSRQFDEEGNRRKEPLSAKAYRESLHHTAAHADSGKQAPPSGD
ncbi:SdpI family protein [Compostibacter hankyongensis]|uniref:SdpI family protein n=1 Tax=Compostibacter hankyongensis TaxID=1007089 RepID=A0ABP8FVR2_9BACT